MMFYSVAEHSVRMTDLVKTKSKKRRVLMHDAAEALGMGDVLHGWKEIFPLYKEIEIQLNMIIAKKYRFPPTFAQESYLKRADKIMALAEVRDLILSDHSEAFRVWTKNWKASELELGPAVSKISRIYPWIPREAKERFLARAHSLGLT